MISENVSIAPLKDESVMTFRWDNTITYEQPLNEPIRLCLRLEHLLQQAQQNLKPSVWSCRTALTAILNAMNIVDRPDLKTKLTKALSKYAKSLSQLEQKPGVDGLKLKAVLDQIDTLIDNLYTNHGKLGEGLRENEFLNTVKQHYTSFGGICAFSTPAFNLWLHQPSEQRIEDLQTWLKAFENLKTIVDMLLKIARDSNITVTKTAENGFYQQALDPNNPCQIVRITVPKSGQLYPEISAGRHGLSVRFFELCIYGEGRDKQTHKDVTFKLNCNGILSRDD